MLFGGFRPAALRRTARWGDGFLCAAPLEGAGQLFHRVERCWQDEGRAGRPRLVAQVNVALGPDAVVDEAQREIRAYYGDGDYTDQAVRRTITDRRRLRDTIAAFGDLGADEVILYCWSAHPTQVERLADAVA